MAMISDIANRVLDDGDDLHQTDSFRPAEDASSTMGVSSRDSGMTPTSLRIRGVRRQQPRPPPRLSGFTEVSSRAFTDYANEKAPPTFWQRLVPSKKFWRPFRSNHNNQCEGNAPRNVNRRITTEAETDDDDDEFDDAHHVIRRRRIQPGSGGSTGGGSSGEVQSVLSIRSHRLNAADGRQLLVRQNGQVVGRASVAAADWEVDSWGESTRGPGETDSIRRIVSLSFDDAASFVSHLTEADYYQRSTIPTSSSRMMYFNPLSTRSLLGSMDDEDEEEDDGEDDETSPDSQNSNNPIFVYDTQSFMSRPSTSFKHGHRLLDNVEEDEEDSSIGTNEDNDLTTMDFLKGGMETIREQQQQQQCESTTTTARDPSQRKRRMRTAKSDPQVGNHVDRSERTHHTTSTHWRPPSPLEGSSHPPNLAHHQTSPDADTLIAQMMENPTERLFPNMEYEGGATPTKLKRTKPKFPTSLIKERPKAVAKSRRATSGPDTCPVEQPMRPKLFADVSRISPRQRLAERPTLWDRRMMMNRQTTAAGVCAPLHNVMAGSSPASKAKSLDVTGAADDALKPSWHRWMSDPEIDIAADIPLPSYALSAVKMREEGNNVNNVILEPVEHQRPRLKSDSEVTLESGEWQSTSTMRSPPRMPSLGLASCASRPRLLSDSDPSDITDRCKPSIEPAQTNVPSPKQQYSSASFQRLSQKQDQRPRKHSDSELTTSGGRPLTRPSGARSHGCDSFVHRRMRILSDSELTISSDMTDLTRPSMQWNTSGYGNQVAEIRNMDDSESGVCGDSSQEPSRPRMFSDSELTATSWASSLHDIPTGHNDGGTIQLAALSSPSAMGAAKQLASSTKTMGRFGAHYPARAVANFAYAAAASNSRCRDYYWNESGKESPILPPNGGTEIILTDSTDSYADVF